MPAGCSFAANTGNLMKKILVLLALAGATGPGALAQKTNSAWVAAFNSFTINKKFSIHFDAQLRSGDQYSQMQTLLLRPGLNYKVSDRLTATAGYAFISNRRVIDGISGYAPEHRTWQQLLYTHPVFHAGMSHRFRLEQRFISKTYAEDDKLENDGNVYANRFRYFLRTVIPFQGRKPFDKGLFGAIQNEVFLNIGNNSAVNGRSFDQNRAYLALGYRLNRKLDLETGYMNQYVQGRGSAFTNNHIIQLAVYTRL
jgi:hypothetical protein